MIINAVITHLITSPDITIDRIYPLRARQDTLKPLAIVELSGNDRVHTFQGTDSWREAQLDVDVYGDTIKSVQDFVGEIIAVLEDYRGAMGDYLINYIRVESESNRFDASIELYVHSFSLDIAYSENE